MELERYRHNLRRTDDEARIIIDKIPVMRSMLTNYKSDLFGSTDNTSGILYLSRLNTDKKKSKKISEVAEDDEETNIASSIDSEEKQRQLDKKVAMTDIIRDKKRRYAMSLSTLAAKPEKREVIVSEGAVSSLIELSQLVDIPIKRYVTSAPSRSSTFGHYLINLSVCVNASRCCASAFALLTSEESIRLRMIEEGAFAAIISLSTAPSKSVKTDCAKALCNLCCEPGNEYRAVKEGTPYATMQIASAVPENTLICLNILLNISCVAEKFARMEEVTDALLHFYMQPLDGKLQIMVMSAFCNLSALRNNQLRLVEDGILRVVERASKSPDMKIRSIASEIVRNLTTDSKTRSKLMDQQIVPTLLVMAKDKIDAVKVSCIRAFYNMSRDTACREKIVASNAVGVIIRMSMEKMSNVDMGRISSKTLRILCCDPVLTLKLVQDGIVKALMALIKTEDSMIRQYCAESICSLFQNESVLDRLIDQGAVNVLVSLSQQSDMDAVTGEWCSFALFQLAINDHCPTSMLEHGLLPCLIKLCNAQSTRTKSFCCAALLSITIKKTVDLAPAIPMLVHMLRHESDQNIKVDCASSLYNLADSDSNCDKMLSAGALIPVVRLTQADYLETKIKCAAILSRLSGHDKYYKQFATDDVLKTLLELSCLDHALTQRRVVIAVTNLSQFAELRGMLLDLKATDYIISLASKPDENIKRGCAAIICNMSYEDGSESAMIQAGTVSTLLITALVTSDQLPTKLICAKALVNLMFDSSFYATMVKDGVIWGLGNLTLLDDSDILNMCAKALCNLSVEYARQMLSSSSTVNAIMKLIKQEGNAELQRYSGRILTNILMQTTDADESFRRQAVLNMEQMASCSDREVNEMCIFCLCLASQSASCRADIVKSGLLRLIDVSSIFSNKSVSFAFLTMFGNIANNPSMRTEVMDDLLIDKFKQICKTHDRALDEAVMNALYTVSCASQNLASLVHQNALDIIEMIMEDTSYELSMEFNYLILAFMHNLTTETSSQAQLVSQKICKYLAKLWPTIVKSGSYELCLLAVTAVCHLALGRVNTAQMVAEGCTEILCFSTQYYEVSGFADMEFPKELVERCSAAFRNLSIAIPNQSAMVDVGAIECIVDLNNMFEEVSSHPVVVQTRRNCASALRSMTYNIDIRQQLVSKGAIIVILNDLTRSNDDDHDNTIGIDLLCELEAESWCNGSRGKAKEARAGAIPPSELYTGLLGGVSNVSLDVAKVSVDQHKFLVRVHLEEPPIETDGTREKLQHGLSTLAAYTDADQAFTPMLMQYPKQPFVEKSRKHKKSAKIFSSGKYMHSTGSPRGAEVDKLEGEEEGEEEDIVKESPSSECNDFEDEHSELSGSIDIDDNMSARSMDSFETRDTISEAVRPLRVSQSHEFEGELGEDSDSDESVASSRLPPIAPSSAPAGTRGGTAGSTRRAPRRSPKRNPDEFKTLVALIKRDHRNKKESDIESVIEKWASLSRY